MMLVYLNDVATEVPCICVNLAQLLHLKGFYRPLLQISVNAREIPLTATHDIILVDGMRICAK